MREIVLTKGRVTTVDDKDFDWLNQYKWYYGKRGYAATGERVGKKTKHTLMHRLIMNTPPGVSTDHIDGNPLNNCRDNLRIVTRSQNEVNKPKYTGKVSKYKGVYRKNNKWMAKITCNGVRHIIGYFTTEEEAALAYNKKGEELFGEYIKLNIV